ncbi:hypothetical protein TorRG33x02_155240, partial [Trema orientale]
FIHASTKSYSHLSFELQIRDPIFRFCTIPTGQSSSLSTFFMVGAPPRPPSPFSTLSLHYALVYLSLLEPYPSSSTAS